MKLLFFQQRAPNWGSKLEITCYEARHSMNGGLKMNYMNKKTKKKKVGFRTGRNPPDKPGLQPVKKREKASTVCLLAA